MGQEQSSTYFDNYPQNYKFIECKRQQPYGEGKIIQSRTTHDKIFQISLESFNDNTDLEKSAKEVQERLGQIQHRLFLNLLNWCEEDSVSLCGKINKISLFYEYYPNNLENLIQSQNTKNQFFTELEVIYFLYSLSNMGILLQNAKWSHRDIRPSNILLSENFSHLKFAPVGTFPNDLTAIERKKFFDEIAYLPPEVVDLNLASYDWQSIDMYACGLTMLDVMSLEFSTDIIQQKNIFEKQKLTKEKLLNLTKRYSVNLVLLIKKMVEIDKKKRLTFTELNTILSQYKEQILTFTQFTLARFKKNQDQILEVSKQQQEDEFKEDDNLSEILIFESQKQQQNGINNQELQFEQGQIASKVKQIESQQDAYFISKQISNQQSSQIIENELLMQDQMKNQINFQQTERQLKTQENAFQNQLSNARFFNNKQVFIPNQQIGTNNKQNISIVQQIQNNKSQALKSNNILSISQGQNLTPKSGHLVKSLAIASPIKNSISTVKRLPYIIQSQIRPSQSPHTNIQNLQTQFGNSSLTNTQLLPTKNKMFLSTAQTGQNNLMISSTYQQQMPTVQGNNLVLSTSQPLTTKVEKNTIVNAQLQQLQAIQNQNFMISQPQLSLVQRDTRAFSGLPNNLGISTVSPQLQQTSQNNQQNFSEGLNQQIVQQNQQQYQFQQLQQKEFENWQQQLQIQQSLVDQQQFQQQQQQYNQQNINVQIEQQKNILIKHQYTIQGNIPSQPIKQFKPQFMANSQSTQIEDVKQKNFIIFQQGLIPIYRSRSFD